MIYGICKSCWSLGKKHPMRGESQGNNIWQFSCTNPNHSYSVYRKWNGSRFLRVKIQPPVYRSLYGGDGVTYNDGKERFISHSLLKKIKSTVTTHEGQLLTDQAGRDYMDKYSKTLLGKDLEGSYRSHAIDHPLKK